MTMKITDTHDLHIVIGVEAPPAETANTDYTFVLAERGLPLRFNEHNDPSPNVPSLICITPTGVVFDGTSPEHRAAFIRSVLQAPGISQEIAPDLHLGEAYPEIVEALRVWAGSDKSPAGRGQSLGVVALLAASFGVDLLVSGRHTVAVEREAVSLEAVAEALDQGATWREARRSKLEFWQSHLCPLVTGHLEVPAAPPDAETIARDPSIN